MPRVILFVNGDAGDVAKVRLLVEPSDTVICADGGVRHALRAGLTPQLIIGDLDSVGDEAGLLERLATGGARVIRHPVEKDATDLELAMDHALAMNADEVIVACPFGGRVDHFLGNILLAMLPKYGRAKITFTDGCQTARVLRGPGTLQLARQDNAYLSLIPLTPSVYGVTTEGLQWALCDAVLSCGSSRTLSNCFAAPAASIAIREGILLAVTGSSK